MQGVGSDERKQRVKEALELVDLAGFEDRYTIKFQVDNNNE